MRFFTLSTGVESRLSAAATRVSGTGGAGPVLLAVVTRDSSAWTEKAAILAGQETHAQGFYETTFAPIALYNVQIVFLKDSHWQIRSSTNPQVTRKQHPKSHARDVSGPRQKQRTTTLHPLIQRLGHSRCGWHQGAEGSPGPAPRQLRAGQGGQSLRHTLRAIASTTRAVGAITRARVIHGGFYARSTTAQLRRRHSPS